MLMTPQLTSNYQPAFAGFGQNGIRHDLNRLYYNDFSRQGMIEPQAYGAPYYPGYNSLVPMNVGYQAAPYYGAPYQSYDPRYTYARPFDYARPYDYARTAEWGRPYDYARTPEWSRPYDYARTAEWGRQYDYPQNVEYGRPDYPRNVEYGRPDYLRNLEYGRPYDYPRTLEYGRPDYLRTLEYGRPYDYPRTLEYGRPYDYPRTLEYGRPNDYARTPEFGRQQELPFGRPFEANQPFFRTGENMMRPTESLQPWGSDAYTVPWVNAAETPDAYLFVVELPGVDLKDVNLQISGATLMLSAFRRPTWSNGTVTVNYHFAEGQFGAMRRVLPLPTGVIPGQIQATFHNGLLTIVLPKTQNGATMPQATSIVINSHVPTTM